MPASPRLTDSSCTRSSTRASTRSVWQGKQSGQGCLTDQFESGYTRRSTRSGRRTRRSCTTSSSPTPSTGPRSLASGCPTRRREYHHSMLCARISTHPRGQRETARRTKTTPCTACCWQLIPRARTTTTFRSRPFTCRNRNPTLTLKSTMTSEEVSESVTVERRGGGKQNRASTDTRAHGRLAMQKSAHTRRPNRVCRLRSRSTTRER